MTPPDIIIDKTKSVTPLIALPQFEKFLIDTYREELIEKGILDETGKKVINRRFLQEKIAEAIKKGGTAREIIKRIMHALGQTDNPIINIPKEAYDSPIDKMPYGTYARNRIGYMRMSDMPLDGSRLGIAHGGLGTGAIMRAPDGSFPTVNFVDIGRDFHDPEGNIASQFHVHFKTEDGKNVAQTLTTRKPNDPQKLSTWKWGYKESEGTYHALYPKSWWTYDDPKLPARVAITAFSPIIPGNYKETSYPVVVYKVKIKNPTDKKMEASTMFTFQNMIGWKVSTPNTWDGKAVKEVSLPGIKTIGGDKAKMLVTKFDRQSTGNYNYTEERDGNVAVVMTGNSMNIESQGQIAIAAPKDPRYTVTYTSQFDADGNGREVQSFFENGKLNNQNIIRESKGKNIGGAVAVSVKLKPGEEIEIPFVLAYDLPKSEFGKGVIRDKEYTKYYGNEGSHAAKIASDALKNHQNWENQVNNWQKLVLNNPKVPSWAKGEILNMLSLHQSDGIYWGKVPGKPYSLHTNGESNGADYSHSETRDVGIYDPSRAILWPKLHNDLMRHFAWATTQNITKLAAFNEMQYKIKGWDKMTISQKRAAIAKQLKKEGVKEAEIKILAKTYLAPLKPFGATPHDIGTYDSDPTQNLNSYTHQNPNIWSELSMVWPLEAYRNFYLGGKKDTQFVKDVYKSVRLSLNYAEKMDKDGDHIPDHQGIPDWTYDNWKVKGINSYTAGLWLTSLEAGIKMAKLVGDRASVQKWENWSAIGKRSFDAKLWDSKNESYRLSVGSRDSFADQLWMLWPKITDLPMVAPEDRVKKTLWSVFKNNVQKFGNGYMGAVNGIRDGKPIEGEQEKEMWTGTSHALGATMLAYGLHKEGWQTIFGTYNMTTNLAKTFGAWAEAYTIEQGIGKGQMFGFRARTYYRALAIWNVLLSLDKAKMQ